MQPGMSLWSWQLMFLNKILQHDQEANEESKVESEENNDKQ